MEDTHENSVYFPKWSKSPPEIPSPGKDRKKKKNVGREDPVVERYHKAQ